jgi:hypothetical protein
MSDNFNFHSRDVQILHQSQSKMALEYATSIGVKLTVEELLGVADVFMECCLRKRDKDLNERIKKMDEWFSKKKVEQNG